MVKKDIHMKLKVKTEITICVKTFNYENNLPYKKFYKYVS